MCDGTVETDALIKLIETYFSLVKDLQHDAWADEEDKYILTKGLGFGSMIYLLPRIIYHTNMKYQRIDADTLRKTLEPLSTVDFLSEGPFAGMQGEKGMQQISEIVASELGLDRLEGGDSLI